MTDINDLLKERRKVIAPYPGCLFNVGDVLIFIPQFMHRIYGTIESTTHTDVFKNGNNIIPASEVDKYPHLFYKMGWWEDRDMSEMPEYVRCVKSPDLIHIAGGVYKCNWHLPDLAKDENGDWICLTTNCYEIATLEDYNNYQQSKK